MIEVDSFKSITSSTVRGRTTKSSNRTKSSSSSHDTSTISEKRLHITSDSEGTKIGKPISPPRLTPDESKPSALASKVQIVSPPPQIKNNPPVHEVVITNEQTLTELATLMKIEAINAIKEAMKQATIESTEEIGAAMVTAKASAIKDFEIGIRCNS